jgi:anti-sigma28 factor (negative regulator of flagellin synthesis)
MEIETIESTRIDEEIVRQVKQLIADGRLKSDDRRRLRGRPAIPDLPPVH